MSGTNGRGRVVPVDGENDAQVIEKAPKASSGGSSVVWKDGRTGWNRAFNRGDGKGPKSSTGFSRRYEFNQENNWTISNMTPEDIEHLQSLQDNQEFRFDQADPEEE